MFLLPSLHTPENLPSASKSQMHNVSCFRLYTVSATSVKVRICLWLISIPFQVNPLRSPLLSVCLLMLNSRCIKVHVRNYEIFITLCG